jgi:eukaryotic translation initiation factor 2C
MDKSFTLPNRPDKGGISGRIVTVATNFFPVTKLAAVKAYQYLVEIEPLASRNARQIFRQCEAHLKETYPQSWFVFDGVSIAFSTSLIPDWKGSVWIDEDKELPLGPISRDHGGGRGGRGRGGGRGDTRVRAPELQPDPLRILSEQDIRGHAAKYNITIRKSGEIDLASILKCAKGLPAEDSEVSKASSCLSVLLMYVPSLLFVPLGSNFYTSEDRIPISGGLELWRGYHQSVRAMMAGHLGINIDLTSTVFSKGGMDLIDYILEVGNYNNVTDLERIPAAQINNIIKGISVVTTHRGEFKQRFKIGKLSSDSAATMLFVPSRRNDQGERVPVGDPILVKDYFQQQYGIRLQFPNLPLVLRGRKEQMAFPMECLRIVPAQKFTKRLSGAATADIIKATVQNPESRRRDIEDAVRKTLKYDKNDYIASFGMEIDSSVMQVKARILPAPSVVFAGNHKIDGKDGAWNLRGNRFVNTPILESLAFIFFVRAPSREAHEISETILRKWKSYGMDVRPERVPVLICNPDLEGNIRGSLMEAFKQATVQFKKRCQLVICIMDGSKSCYDTVKTTCLCEASLVTQCMLYKHVSSARNIKDQYIANVALKVR